MALTPTLCAVRFGTGLSPDIAPPSGADDILARLAGPDRAREAFPQGGWSEAFERMRTFDRLRRARDTGEAAMQAFRDHNRMVQRTSLGELGQTIARAARTEDGFRERLAWFWADHFSVSETVATLRRAAAGYHEDAIRPHVTGRFADLLKAAVLHPAMLAYLDQTRSVGPNSRRGGPGVGLNENLARELLELHTLGVGGSYTQGDVRQLAELLTGLGIDKDGVMRFRVNFAEPGSETVLGRDYGGGRADIADIEAALEDLAVHPDTARHIAGKLATHFLSDDPPADLVQAVAATWLSTGGDLMPVYATLLTHPAAADPTLHKVRRPLEYIAAAYRALGLGGEVSEAGIRVLRDTLYDPLQQMGQRWQRAPGPNGWPEESEAWITPQGLAARITWSMELAARLPDPPDPRDFVQTALADLASPRTLFAAQAAEDRAAGIGLILTAPEFQRR